MLMEEMGLVLTEIEEEWMDIEHGKAFEWWYSTENKDCGLDVTLSKLEYQ